MDTSAELGANVVGLAGRALGFQVRDAVGAIGELEDQVEGASDVAFEAIDHQLTADGGDGVPDGVLQHRGDEGGEIGVGLRSQVHRGRPGTRRVPAMVDEVLQRQVCGVAAFFPDVALGHDLLQLLGRLGHC